MRYIISITLFLLITASSSAQTTIYLSAKGGLHHIHELPFDKVIVFDNCFDTAKKAWFEEQNILVKLDSSTTLAIKPYMETAIRKYPKKNRVLYISLKQSQIGIEGENKGDFHKFYFSLNAYFKVNDTYRKVGSIKKKIVFWLSADRTIRRELNKLIEKIDYNCYHNQDIDTSSYTFADITSNATIDWMNYPIMKQGVYTTNGVYESINDFRNNKIMPINFSMKIGSDSAYSISFSGGNKYYNGILDYYHNIFVVCYNRCLYIKIGDKYFLPLSKINNKFCFNVPLSLPNMPAINDAKNLPYPSDPGNTNGATSIGGALFGIAINTATKSHRDKVYNEEKQNIINQGLEDKNMRHCSIDMDTGGIIYF